MNSTSNVEEPRIITRLLGMTRRLPQQTAGAATLDRIKRGVYQIVLDGKQTEPLLSSERKSLTFAGFIWVPIGGCN